MLFENVHQVFHLEVTQTFKKKKKNIKQKLLLIKLPLFIYKLAMICKIVHIYNISTYINKSKSHKRWLLWVCGLGFIFRDCANSSDFPSRESGVGVLGGFECFMRVGNVVEV